MSGEAGEDQSRFDRARTPTGSSVGFREVFEDLAGDVAFQDAGDLAHGFAFGETPSDVVACWLVVFHAGEHDVEQRRVGLSVTAPVQAMPDGLTRRCWDRRYSAEVREGSFGADLLRVVAYCDQQLGGSGVSNAVDLEEAGGGVAE